MNFSQLGMRGRLLLSAVLPAILMMLILELVFLNHYQDDLERSFEERGLAIVRQIGSAAEYALFSGSREALDMLAEGARRSDPAINSVSVLGRNGNLIVCAGVPPQHPLSPKDILQVRKMDDVTSVMVPIHQASLMLNADNESWRTGSQETREPVTGYILVEISRAELAARQSEMLKIMLTIMVGGLLLASWLSLRLAGGVLSSLDSAHMALRRQKEYAELLARTDALTGLANRRAFDEVAEQEVKRALRYNTPLVLIMTDLDHFKAINDRHGHHVGDQVLQHFARILSASVRNIDLVGRWGGEEFAVLMPGTDLEEATRLANSAAGIVVGKVGTATATRTELYAQLEQIQ